MSENYHRLAALAEVLAAATVDPAGWPVFLQQLSKHFDANSIGVSYETFGAQRQGTVTMQHGLIEGFSGEYQRYYAPLNPIIQRGLSQSFTNAAHLGQSLCSEKELRASEFYNDFLKQADILQVLGGTIDMSPDGLWVLSVCGSHSRRAFDESEASQLRCIMPQIRAAVLLQQKLRMLEDRVGTLENAFHSYPDAVILVDEQARILALNASASALLMSSLRVVQCRGDYLELGGKASSERLRRALQAITIAKRLQAPAPCGHSFAVRGADSNWLVQIFPVEKGRAGHALVFLMPEQIPEDEIPSESDLQNLFGLSPAQRRVAALLYAGQSVEQAADQLGVSRNTFKTHARRLFDKLAISRQSELVRLFARLKKRR